jgi:P27 family predicted phage terminase small subunit
VSPHIQKKAAPPAHLSADSKAWWREVVAAYELEPQHLRTLQLAAEAWDRVAQARRILAKEGVTFRDRFGKPRKHPAIGVEEQARLAFLRCVRELDLEGEPHPGYRR